MNNVIISLRSDSSSFIDEGNCILDNGGVIRREVEVLDRQIMDTRVKLDNGGIDAMSNNTFDTGADS